MVSTLLGSVFHTFHGSHSVIYLLPMRASTIASFCASRNLYVSSRLSTFSFTSLNASTACLSTSFSSPQAGTIPSKYFFVSCKALLTKLPYTATSSLLLRSWKSFHVKLLSFVSGALAVSTYLSTSCLPGKSSKYSCSHTAQFFEVDILSSSKFRNSFAGTFSGSIYPPCALSITGNTMQWNTMLSLPMKCTKRVSGSFHHFSHVSGNNSLVLDM